MTSILLDLLGCIPENKRRRVLFLGLVWVLSAVYVYGFIDRGWVPYDEGSLAQMAERVLQGELPHRDFDEIYTGGLSFLYAAAFKVLGVNFISIRIVLYIFFLAFVPAVYCIALRFVSPPVAAAVTLLAVVWSVPNYFTGLPSWYNLFFAIFGTLALIRHIETQHGRWLLIAGLCGGISFLTKVSGVYYIAAVLLFLTYREQVLSSGGSRFSKPHFSSFFIFKGLGYLAFTAALIWLLRFRLGPVEIFHLVLPAVSICGILLWTECMEGQGSFHTRVKRLGGVILPFSLGTVIPVSLFLVPYVLSGSLGDFCRGVFVLSQKRLEYASIDFPPLATGIAAVPYGLLLFINLSPNGRSTLEKIFATMLALTLGFALASGSNSFVYRVIWHSARSLSVLAVLAGCWLLARSFQRGLISPTNRQILVLLVVMTSLQSLIQFPFAAPIYYCYMAPLVALTVLAVASFQSSASKLLHLGALSFYFLFALLWMNTSYGVVSKEHKFGLGNYFSAYGPQSRFDNSRAGIRVTTDERDTYDALVKLVRQHAKSGYIYAGPDCPEVYFLAGLRNPTRKIFDFLSSVQEEASSIPALLKSKDIKVAVINRHSYHSPALDKGVAAVLQEKFPQSADLGGFTVRWKD